MKKIQLSKKAKIIILSAIICVVVIAISIPLLVTIIRTNNINKQARTNIDMILNRAYIYCNGKNISLKNDTCNLLKESNIDLVIVTDDYAALIDKERINTKMELDINSIPSSIMPGGVDFSYVGTIPKELYVKETKLIKDKSFLSEFKNIDNTNEFVSNKIKKDEAGYFELELVEGINSYTFAYIIPDEINVNEISMNSSTRKIIELGIDESEYTVGSITVEANDKESIKIINNGEIESSKAGEYTLTFTSEKGTKEVKLTVLPSVEKIESEKVNYEIVKGKAQRIVIKYTPEDAVNKELIYKSSDENIATVDGNGNVTGVNVGSCEIEVTTKIEPTITIKIPVEIKEPPSITSVIGGNQVTGITYINGIMLVNKTHPVPSNYAPGLQTEAYNAFLQLRNGAAQAGHDIQLLSGFRSYETQTYLYNNYVATYGQAEADTFSARPGTSEHQTGLAMDVGWIDDAYANTPSGQWLAANCYKYGFIIRYPKSKESITGYKYEPWHIRYLGVDIATDVFNSGLCLEEYLGVTN